MLIKLLHIFLLTSLVQSQSLFRNPQWIGKANAQAVTQLLSYYRPSETGSFPESAADDATGFQWYESGIIWGSLMDYTLITRDARFVKTISSALGNASFGQAASFLGGKKGKQFSGLTGKWNDDILWWALGGNQCFFTVD